MKSFITSSIIGIVLSVLFINIFDHKTYGLIIGQIISQIVYNSWYWMLKAHKELSLSFNETVKLGYTETISALKTILKTNKNTIK